MRRLSVDIVQLLTAHGIQPSAHRVAVAQYVLTAHDHPSADRVWDRVRDRFPMISRATVYNTLNLFVEKGLLRELHLAAHSVVFDPNMERHHHLIEEESGKIHDVEWNKVEVKKINDIPEFEINEYQVVMYGRPRNPKSQKEKR